MSTHCSCMLCNLYAGTVDLTITSMPFDLFNCCITVSSISVLHSPDSNMGVGTATNTASGPNLIRSSMVLVLLCLGSTMNFCTSFVNPSSTAVPTKPCP